AAGGRRGKQSSSCGVTASFRAAPSPDRLAIVGASHKMGLQPEVRGGHGQSDPSESKACASQVEGQGEGQAQVQVEGQIQAQVESQIKPQIGGSDRKSEGCGSRGRNPARQLSDFRARRS